MIPHLNCCRRAYNHLQAHTRIILPQFILQHSQLDHLPPPDGVSSSSYLPCPIHSKQLCFPLFPPFFFFFNQCGQPKTWELALIPSPSPFSSPPLAKPETPPQKYCLSPFTSLQLPTGLPVSILLPTIPSPQSLNKLKKQNKI